MDDNYQKQMAEPIPTFYRITDGEFGGGVASIATERWRGGRWSYCPQPSRCQARKKKINNP